VALEDARAIGELTVLGREHADLLADAVVRAHADEHARYLLAVGADVLNRRGAHRARYPGQRLHAGQAVLHARGDERVPVLTGLHVEPHATVGKLAARDPAREDLHDGAGEARVGDDDVAASGEHEQWLAGGVGRAHRSDDVLLRARLQQAPGRAAEPQRRQLAERGVHGHRRAG
jgi:hypothetical protein